MEKEMAASIFLPGSPVDGGTWWADVYGVTRDRLKQQQQQQEPISNLWGDEKLALILNSLYVGEISPYLKTYNSPTFCLASFL